MCPMSTVPARSGVTISELAERTGVPVATLRTWESRYGAPRPQRLANGHRRYDEAEVVLVQEIVRLRSSGLELAAAVAQAQSLVEVPKPSLYAALRTAHPDLQPRVLTKTSLLALSRALEDECCAQAQDPVLFAGFQNESHFRASQARWSELARTAGVAVVFADFARNSSLDAKPVRVRLPETAPLRREWFLVCDALDRPACVTAWETPGQHSTREADRRFETLWTVEPQVVREAARICASMTTSLSPDSARLFGDRLAATPPQATTELRRAQRLFERIVAYLTE